MHKQFLRPTIEYARSVAATSFFQSTPIDHLHLEIKIASLELHLNMKGTQFQSKVVEDLTQSYAITHSRP